MRKAKQFPQAGKGLALVLFITILCSACTKAVKKEDLTGKWKYIKVENPEQTPPHFIPRDELKASDPSIEFTSDNNLTMIWDKKVLSRGTYKIEYPNIVFHEQLSNGATRDIRFLIKECKDGELVFQTQEADPVRVTARKMAEK